MRLTFECDVPEGNVRKMDVIFFPSRSTANPDVFLEAEWTYRTWRYFVGALACGLLGGFALFVTCKAFFHQQDIWEHYNWVLGVFFAAFGVFFISISMVIFWRLIVGIHETSRIGIEGIKIGNEHWRWDQMRFIRPTKDSLGGIVLLIALKGKADRRFWIGRPLRTDEFNELNEHMRPFLESKYPHLIE